MKYINEVQSGEGDFNIPCPPPHPPSICLHEFNVRATCTL